MINLGELGPAILRSIFKPQETGAETRFAKGDIVEGYVIRTLGRDGALVRIRGINMIAATQTRLEAGQSILVKVEQVKPQFVVSLLLNDTPMQEKTAALLRLYLPSAMPVSAMLSELEMLAASLAPAVLKGSGLKSVLAELKNAVMRYSAEGKNVLEMLGLFLESELSRKKPAQNLKRSLLVVRRNLERLMAKDPLAYREPLNRVTRALQNIELRQLINLAERQEMKSWQIPYWSGSELASARLYIKRELTGKSKTKRKTTTRLTLMMEMSRLGPIRMEMLAYREKMEGTFYLLTEKAAAEIGKKLPELVEALKSAGFTAGFGVQRATMKFLTEELLDETALPVKRLLNVKV